MKLETFYNVYPWHTNHFGTLHGGIYMSWLIDTGGLLMSRVSRGSYVLASLDYILLLSPVKVNDVLRVVARATATWKSSVEMIVTGCVTREGKEIPAVTSMMTFVALDEFNKPRDLPTSIPPTEESEERRKERLLRRERDRRDTLELVGKLSFVRTYTRTIYPEHAFFNGILYAGKMYTMLDEALAIIAKMYSKGNVFTAGAGYADFYSPVKVGDILEIQGGVDYVGNTSIDVGSKVFAINYFTGTKTLVTKTVFSFVAIDSEGKPKTIPKYTPSSSEEVELFEARRKERERRLEVSKKVKETLSCIDL